MSQNDGMPKVAAAAGRRAGDAPIERAVDAGAILAAVGGVAYEWTIADDTIRWDDAAVEVLGLPSLESIATGRAFAALLDPTNPASRHDAVFNSTAVDNGSGSPTRPNTCCCPSAQAAGVA